MTIVDEAIAELERAGGNFRCRDMVGLLESLGFVVEPCRQPTHKKVKHPALPRFFGAGFACEHRGNAGVRQCYINSMKRMLVTWKDELETVV